MPAEKFSNFEPPKDLLSPLVHAVVFSLLLVSPFAFGSVQIWARSLIGIHVCVLAFILALRRPPEILMPPLWMVALGTGIIVLGFLSATYSPYPAESLRMAFDMTVGLGLFILIFNYYRDSRHVFSLALFLLTCALAVCFFAFLREGLNFWQSDRPGFSGPFANHNHFCAFLEITTPFAFCLLMYEIRARKDWTHLLFFGVSFLVGMFTIFSTLSRAGLVSILSSLLLVSLGFFFLSRRRKMAWVMIATILFFFALLLFLAYPSFERIATSLIEEGGLKENFRVRVWLITFKMIANSPWWGHGLGSYPFISYRFRDADIRHHVNYAHNEFLHFFAENGVFSFVLLFSLALMIPIFYFYRLKFIERSTKSMALVLAAMMALCSIFLHSFYDFTIHIPAVAVYLLVVLGGTLHLVIDRVRVFPGLSRGFRVAVMMFSVAGGIALLVAAVADGLYWGSKWPGISSPNRVSLLQGAIKINPFVAEYQTDLGLEWATHKNYVLAKPYFHRAIYLNKARPSVYFYLANIAEEEGDRESAQTLYEKSIELDPMEPKKFLGFLKFLVDTDQREKSFLLCYDGSRRMNSVFLPCLRSLAWLDVEFSNLIKLVPNHPVSKIQFGNFLIEQQLWDSLQQYVSSLTTDFPYTPAYFRMLAVNAEEEGRVEDALSFARQGLKRFPFDENLTLALGSTLEKQARFDEALQVYVARHRIDETDDQWLKKIVKIWAVKGKDSEIDAFYQKLEEKYPRSIRLREARLAFYYENQKWREAESLLNEMIRQGFKSDENRLRLARHYQSRRQFLSAVDVLEPLYRKDSRNKEVLFFIGDCYLAAGRKTEAKTYFEALLRIDTANAAAAEKMREINGK